MPRQHHALTNHQQRIRAQQTIRWQARLLDAFADRSLDGRLANFECAAGDGPYAAASLEDDVGSDEGGITVDEEEAAEGRGMCQC